MKRATNADALNVVQNNGPAAGQAIPHVHIHVIPRFEKDGLSLGVFRQGKYEGNEILAIRDAIKSKIPEKRTVRKIERIEEPEEKEAKEEKPKKKSSQAAKYIKREIEIA